MTENNYIDLISEATQELTSEPRMADFELSLSSAAALSQFLGLLLKWNDKMDLVAPAEPEAQVQRHILDSLGALHLLESLDTLKPELGPVIDVGTGAGLPGLVFALSRPNLEMVLVEPRQKRQAFLRECKRTLGIKNVQLFEGRIQELTLEISNEAQALTARALGREDVLVGQAQRLKVPKAFVLAGPNWEKATAGPTPAESINYRLGASGPNRKLIYYKIEKLAL